MLRRYKKSIKIIIFVSTVFFIFILTLIKIDRDIRPILFAVSDSEVRIIATECINRIVKEEMSKDTLYESFVNVKSDKNGDIASIDLNTVEMNKFGSNVALRVQKEMSSIGETGVSIPLGIVTGSTILSYYGPRINVKMMPVGYVTCKYESELQSAGINQTRYMVYIQVETTMQVMVPLGKDKMNVASTIPVVETLIVGKVPTLYSNNSSGSSNVITVPVPNSN